MPTTPRPKPAVDPELLQPIPDIPDKMNRLLDMLAATTFGEIQPLCALLETSTTQVQRVRDKNPEFDRRIAQIQLQLADNERAKTRKRVRDKAHEGVQSETKEFNADGELVKRTVTTKDDSNLLLRYAESIMPEFIRNRQLEQDDSDQPDAFVFNPGGSGPAELEAGEVVAEEET